MKQGHLRHIAELNIAVLLISTSGVLGRYISIAPPITIWLRCVLAIVIIGAYCYFNKISIKITTKKSFKTFIISGVFLGVHWITYFYALQYSNVAVAMLSLFTYPVITALLEPLFLKSKLNPKHIFLGILVLAGIYYLTPQFNFNSNLTIGVIFGLISSFFYAIRNILMKKKISQYNGSVLMFYQLAVISLLFWPVLFVFDTNNQPTNNDWLAILSLAFVTTALGHTLFVKSFRNFSISTASIISSIQPVYGILFAFFLLNEIPSEKTIIGGLLILFTVIVESIKVNKR